MFAGKWKRDKISKTGEAMLTKIGAFYIHLYLHKIFEPILFFDSMDYSPWSEGKIEANEKGQNFWNQRGHA